MKIADGSGGLVIKPADTVKLARSGRTTVQHIIAWGQFSQDELVVKVTASDPALVVPKELKLEFEKNQFFFEYELQAGNKTGEFTVTLTPSAGQAVVVKVVVK